MANFPTHISTSAVLGAAYGTTAHVVYGMPLPSCLLSAGLFTIGGVLPDVDSDNAVILRELIAFVSAVIPFLLLDHFRSLGWPQESIVVASGLLYIMIRFGVGEIIRRLTVHRGMWHSVPTALIVGSVIYLLCACPDWHIRMLKTASIVVGFLWHLILDEIYAVESGSRGVRIKRSFGTAFKFFGSNPMANVWAYTNLAGMIALLMWYQPAQNHSHDHPFGSGQYAEGGQHPDPNYGFPGYTPQTQMTPVPSGSSGVPPTSGGSEFGYGTPRTDSYPAQQPYPTHPNGPSVPYYGPGYGPSEYVPPTQQPRSTTPRYEW